MQIALYTNSISPHQIPLAREIVKVVGVDNYCYIYTKEQTEERLKLGWSGKGDGADLRIEKINEENKRFLEEVEVLIVGGIRPIELMERRLKAGKTTLYMSERWFKPVWLGVRGWCLGVSVPGWIRMIVPSYWKMAKRFANLFKYERYRFLPIGPWAKKDMRLICKVFGVKMAEEKVVDWGYFVAPSENKLEKVVAIERSEIAEGLHGQRKDNVLRVLWVGRMLKLKRVDTIIRAVVRIIELEKVVGVGQRRDISLTLVGDGPERKRLEGLVHSAKLEGVVRFMPSQPIEKIREIMREHDVYVFSSNAYEGWGAVVSEALEEGMNVIGTFEAGSSAAILPEANLFHAGDYKTLAKKLSGKIEYIPIGKWSAKAAAERLINLCE